MADDAAGAVRRTPRPAPEPDADELVNQTQMLGFGVERGVATLSLKPPREIVLAWVDAARAMLGEAPNYSETRVDFPTEKAEMEVSAAGEYERFVFTVQRAGKLTPHEARRKAEAERDALQAQIAAALALMDYWDAHGGSIPQGHRLRAALQGDQPTEPDERLAGMARPAEGVQLIADAFGIAPAEAAAQLRDAIRAAARIDLDEAAQPTGEADRG